MRALTFSATLLDTGEMTLEPGFVVEGEPSAGDGELTVEVITRAGKVIAITQLPLVAPCGYPVVASTNDHPPRVVVGLVAFPEKAGGLRVIHEGRTLVERAAPRGRGEPKVEWPDNLVAGAASIRWSASPKRRCS